MAVDQEDFPCTWPPTTKSEDHRAAPLTFGPAWLSDTGPRDISQLFESGEPKTRSELPASSAFRETKKIKKIRRGPGPAGTKLSDAQRGGCPAREESPLLIDRPAG